MLERTPHVRDVSGAGMSHVSQDGRAALVTFALDGDPETAADRLAPAVHAVARVRDAHPGLRLDELGDASGERSVDAVIERDFRRAELSTLPITFLILLFAFGACVAAGIPVILAFTSVLTALGASILVSHVIPASDSTASVILLMGMAVGVDYSLFTSSANARSARPGTPPRRRWPVPRGRPVARSSCPASR